jgi:hypothetical protein
VISGLEIFGFLMHSRQWSSLAFGFWHW